MQDKPRPSQAPGLTIPGRPSIPPKPSQAPTTSSPKSSPTTPGAPRKLKRSFATVWDELLEDTVGAHKHPYIFPKFNTEDNTARNTGSSAESAVRESDPVRQRLNFDTDLATQPMTDQHLHLLPAVPPLPPRPGSAQFKEAPLSSRLNWTMDSMDMHVETSQRCEY